MTVRSAAAGDGGPVFPRPPVRGPIPGVSKTRPPATRRGRSAQGGRVRSARGRRRVARPCSRSARSRTVTNIRRTLGFARLRGSGFVRAGQKLGSFGAGFARRMGSPPRPPPRAHTGTQRGQTGPKRGQTGTEKRGQTGTSRSETLEFADPLQLRQARRAAAEGRRRQRPRLPPLDARPGLPGRRPLRRRAGPGAGRPGGLAGSSRHARESRGRQAQEAPALVGAAFPRRRQSSSGPRDRPRLPPGCEGPGRSSSTRRFCRRGPRLDRRPRRVGAEQDPTAPTVEAARIGDEPT